MIDRGYTLSEITRACDAPLAKARQQPNVDRALDLFVQGVVDALKALPVEPVEYTMTEMGWEPGKGYYKETGGRRTHHGKAPRLPQKSD